MRGDASRNLVAALSYLLGFVTGIVILLVEKNDRFIRFHAMQSTILFSVLFLVNIFIGFLFSPIGILEGIFNIVIWLIWLVVWVISMYKAYSGEVFKWPVVGEIAERKVKE